MTNVAEAFVTSDGEDSLAESLTSSFFLDNENEFEELFADESDVLNDTVKLDSESIGYECLKEDVRLAASRWFRLEEDMGIPSVQIEPSTRGIGGTCSVVLTLSVNDLPGALLLPKWENTGLRSEARLEMIRHLWDLGSAMTVAVIVDGISKNEFRAATKLPTILARIDCLEPSKFTVGECLIQAVKPLISNTFYLKENQPPSEIGSFFLSLYEHLKKRMKTLTEYCLMCGTKVHRGLLPSICDGQLCQYQYQELGLVNDLTTPRVSAPVLSLLLTVFNAAVSSDRWKDVLTPAPASRNLDKLMEEARELHYQIGREWIFMETGGYDVHSMLGRVMPCAHDFLETPADYRKFKNESPHVAEFVEWLVLSNQSSIELVPEHLNVPFLRGEDQFLCITDSPMKQAEFESLVDANRGRTRFLFYGSQCENWHSIIRSGLQWKERKFVSGSKFEISGECYGDGIYLSKHLSLAFPFCSEFDERFISETCEANDCSLSEFTLVAVVEVVDTPEAYVYNNTTGQSHVVVVKDEKWCQIKMLVAYHGHVPPNININAIRPSDRMKILDLVNEYKAGNWGSAQGLASLG